MKPTIVMLIAGVVLLAGSRPGVRASLVFGGIRLHQ